MPFRFVAFAGSVIIVLHYVSPFLAMFCAVCQFDLPIDMTFSVALETSDNRPSLGDSPAFIGYRYCIPGLGSTPALCGGASIMPSSVS